MVHAKNYETVSTFVIVIQKKTVASFFPDMVYMYIIMIKTTQFNLSFSLTQQLSVFFHLSVYPQHCVMSCTVVGKQTGPSLHSYWFFCCRPGQAEAKWMRARPSAQAESKALTAIEAETEAEAHNLASRPFWPRGLDISG